MKTVANNVVQFPTQRSGGNRFARPLKTQSQLSQDLLAIANYFDACANGSSIPKWMKAMASEARAMCRDMQG